ncbi:SRPBCC family protein [Flavobacterium urocaniciphilum]|uniref:Ligand-binding SRPBCC domain-containing protein n=1 Tax=Flavobacterium urocaniciphilum TaxID=1299341 RepID=A0A1H8ZIZ2_9FLAO|nr:SRPBCC family protein [Flavobacterium urocaniciphilum]SEP64416.1 Ligand-binding SRPBCC domain-containing protein [Flavobacterium urocaniciphilum]
MIYKIHTKQSLPISKKEAWEFLSDPNNLKEITPNSMKFEVLSGADKKMYAGQIIEYFVSPLLGIKMKWVTEITHVIQDEYFVDEQRFGPYTFWHHKHFIKEIPGGIEMEDIVHYKLPFGFLGKLAHAVFVKSELQKIFTFRREKLNQLFGEIK